VPDVVTAHPSQRDDCALLDAIDRGDEQALATLYDRHSPLILGVTMRIVGERVGAETVLLDTFTQAWRDAGRYDASRGPVTAWLIMIARSRALDFVRSAARQARVGAVSVDDVAPSALAADESTTSPLRNLENSERASIVSGAVGSLPEAQRVAIELAFYEGLSHSEIAERLREPLGTIKTRIRLGMTKLRQLLEPHREGVTA
jgi:RNA polymerase sigma-70 factor (ECF subfamily)